MLTKIKLLASLVAWFVLKATAPKFPPRSNKIVNAISNLSLVRTIHRDLARSVKLVSVTCNRLSLEFALSNHKKGSTDHKPTI